MGDEINYMYDAKLERNILVVERTGFGELFLSRTLEKIECLGKQQM